MRLTEAQKNSVRSALLRLEESLDEIGAISDAGGKTGVLYQLIGDLDDRETGKLRKGIAEMKVVIGQLAGQMDVKHELLSMRRTVIGRLSLLWEMLCSVGSKGLKAYGDVDESLRTELDPEIGKLTGLIESMIAVLTKAEGA